MDKLKDGFKNLVNKFKAMSKGAKIALIVSIAAIVIAVVTFFIYSNGNKYGILFSNLDPIDAQTVTAKLKEQKIDTKISGNTIMVPTASVDELRLQLAPTITNGSTGYELMDQSNSFGMTDEQFAIQKQRMLEGELEKTIKSFTQVQNARVHITAPTDSVFAKDKQPGKAAVYISLKLGEKLTDDQVRSIVALVSGSTESLPKENVEVIDDKMNLLSKGLFDAKGDSASSSSVEKQQGLEKDYETKLENKINELLIPVIGKDKVKATVTATMDFDSTQKTQDVYDPNKVIQSEHIIKENTANASGANSQSPVDSNLSNTISTGNSNNQDTKQDDTTEYAVGKTETTVISAPGQVKRLTASVVVDGTLDSATTDAIKNIVSTAIGYKQDRGDEINVLGIAFDPTQKAEMQKQIDALKAETDAAKKTQLIKMIAGSALGLIGLIIVIIIIVRKRKPNETTEKAHMLDVVVNDKITPKEVQVFEPINFEKNDQRTHIESEIKKYATEKPEQVADIIKSWLADNER